MFEIHLKQNFCYIQTYRQMKENMEKANENNVDSNWFKKHAETLTVIAALFSGFIWMDSKFSTVDSKFDKVSDRLSGLEKDVAVIKTVLSIKGINCNELASSHQESKQEK
jgi:hypothetical protein